MITQSLDGRWQLFRRPLARQKLGTFRSDKAIIARVPGEVHLDLMRAGEMPEPFIGTNAKKCRWPENSSWWYRRTFRVSAEFCEYEKTEIEFDGLDHTAVIYLNGEKIGESQNSFIRHRFDVKGVLKKGENEIVVCLRSGKERIKGETPREHVERYPEFFRHRRVMDETRGQIRKPQYCWGWDWVEGLPNIGIWRSVRLVGKDQLELHDVRLFSQVERNQACVDLEITVRNLHDYESRKGKVEFSFAMPDGRVIRRSYKDSFYAGCSVIRDRIEIDKPCLWWPNGLGEANLNRVRIKLKQGSSTRDQREFDYGLRKIEIDRSALKHGYRFCLRVNDEDVFCRGANWVPADGIPARIPKAHYRKLVSEAKEANYNMLRVWGGGVYEDPEFYSACDREGILVFQDFMFACSSYPGHLESFRDEVRQEAESVIRDLRHHASIALWCGNNENLSWLVWGRCTRDAVPIYHQVLADVCRYLDPERFYWPSSPLGGKTPQSQIEGDNHMGYTRADLFMGADAFDKNKTRFLSECGAMGPPDVRTMKACVGKGNFKRGSEAWQLHTNLFSADFSTNAIRHHYADPEGMKERRYLELGAHAQAFIYEHQYLSQRFRKNDPNHECQGILIWMFNDCWNEIGWSIIDQSLRRKPSFYSVRRACRPLKVILRPRGRGLTCRLVNDGLQAGKVEVCYGLVKSDGSRREIKRKALNLKANAMHEIGKIEVKLKKQEKREWIAAAWVEQKGQILDQCTWLFTPYREMSKVEADIKTRAVKGGIEVRSEGFAHQVHARGDMQRYLSEGYFDLIPGIPLIVKVKKNSLKAKRVELESLATI